MRYQEGVAWEDVSEAVQNKIWGIETIYESEPQANEYEKAYQAGENMEEPEEEEDKSYNAEEGYLLNHYKHEGDKKLHHYLDALYNDLYQGVEEVDVADWQMSPKQFNTMYVSKNNACLLPGMAEAMPAFKKWKKTAYLQKKIGEMEFEIEKRSRDNEFAYFTKGFKTEPMTYN
jgi:hypothetical protein